MTRRGDAAVSLALRAALLATGVLPRGVARALGATLGRLARDPLALRRAVADHNLGIAFPELTVSERAALGRRMYAHFGRMAADVLHFARNGPATLPSLVDESGHRRLIDDLVARGRGIILLTGHLGNWELAGAWLGARGLAPAVVVKPPTSRLAARFAEEARRRLGIGTIPMAEARSGVLTALRAGRAVGLVADQSPIHGSTWVPFFGRPTKTPEGPGLFAARSGAPVVFGAMTCEPGGRFRLSLDVLDEDPKGGTREVIERIAGRYRARLEREIRRVPEQYLWTHRLWRRKPPATFLR